MGFETDKSTGDRVLYDSNGNEIARYNMDTGEWQGIGGGGGGDNYEFTVSDPTDVSGERATGTYVPDSPAGDGFSSPTYVIFNAETNDIIEMTIYDSNNDTTTIQNGARIDGDFALVSAIIPTGGHYRIDGNIQNVKNWIEQTIG